MGKLFSLLDAISGILRVLAVKPREGEAVMGKDIEIISNTVEINF